MADGSILTAPYDPDATLLMASGAVPLEGITEFPTQRKAELVRKSRQLIGLLATEKACGLNPLLLKALVAVLKNESRVDRYHHRRVDQSYERRLDAE